LLPQRRSGSALPLTGPASQEGVLAAEPNAINPAGIPPLVEARSAEFDFRPVFRHQAARNSDLKSAADCWHSDRPSHAPFAEHMAYPL